MTDVLYFQKKLYRALNVPESRMQVESTYNVGRSTEIQRDEVKFSKFVNRIRLRFSDLFVKSLEKQLVLKGVMSLDEWQDIVQDVKFDYAQDNYFAELKNLEMMKERLGVLIDLENFAGRYVSHVWIRKNILQQTDEEIEQIDEEMEQEDYDPRYQPPAPPGQDDTQVPPPPGASDQ
jgi:hypothetical protein